MTSARTLSGQPAADEREPDLVRDLKARSPQAWEQLFNDHYERLVRYVAVRVRNLEEAQDVASSVFLRALKNIDTYRYTGKPVVAWLYGIAQNLLRERFRRVKQETGFDASEALLNMAAAGTLNGASGSTAHIERLDLEIEISRLTPLQQEVLVLRYIAGFRGREVASMLGKSERAVYYLEARGLVRLRDSLGLEVKKAGQAND